VTRIVMAYFGAQMQGASATTLAAGALHELSASFDTTDGPGHWDRSRYVDEAGFTNVICAAYWDQPARFERWFAVHGQRWTREPRPDLGTFIELVKPGVERYETLFSAPDRREGVAHLASGMSDMVLEHAYWGGARDRIAASQTDAMDPLGAPQIVRDGALVSVRPHDNLCLIRSGQDWGDTEADERAMYQRDVEPVLRAGMDFLRDDGVKIGCYANRYVQVETRDGLPTEKSYGMSWWKSLAALERWAESHPTHVAIFGAAMKYLSTLGPAAKLKLYHEVTVARVDDQLFEYLNCHARTGMQRAA
jgi:aldoxime dehydratase